MVDPLKLCVYKYTFLGTPSDQWYTVEQNFLLQYQQGYNHNLGTGNRLSVRAVLIEQLSENLLKTRIIQLNSDKFTNKHRTIVI